MGTASPALCAFMRALNDKTGFVVDGSTTVPRSNKGARPRETIADLIFIFLLGKVTKEVRAAIDESEYCVSMPFNPAGFVDRCLLSDSYTTAILPRVIIARVVAATDCTRRVGLHQLRPTKR